MPKNNILYGIPVLGERLRHFMRRNKYKMTARSLYDGVIENINNGSAAKEEHKRILNNKELKSLLKKKFKKDGVETSISAYLIKENLPRVTPLVSQQNKLEGFVLNKEQDDNKSLKSFYSVIEPEEQLLTSRRGSNASFYSAETSFDDIGDNTPKPQIKTCSVLPPIFAKPKNETVKPFTLYEYQQAINKIQKDNIPKDNKIKELSDAFGVKIKGEKEELAGPLDFTSSIGGVFGGNILAAKSFSSKSEVNFNACKKDYATMLQFCHIKDIMDLKENIVIDDKGKKKDLGNRQLHDALSDSSLSASLFLTDKTVKLNTPESLNAVYNDLKNGGLNDFNTIAGDILSGAQKQDNKEMRYILSANVLFYSDENVDKDNKKYSTKSQNATNEALEKSNICKDIIIELVLKNPDAMKNINIMICSEKELKEYTNKAGTSFGNTNIKELFKQKMPQKIQEWHKWIKLGKGIDCDKYPEFGKFKQNVYELSQEDIKDLDKKINNTVIHTEKEEIKALREDFKKSLNDAFTDIETVRQV